MRLPTYDEQNEFIMRNIAPFLFGDFKGIKDVFSRMYNSIRGAAGDFVAEVVLALNSNAYGTVKVPETQPVNNVLVVGPNGEAPEPKPEEPDTLDYAELLKESRPCFGVYRPLHEYSSFIRGIDDKISYCAWPKDPNKDISSDLSRLLEKQDGNKDNDTIGRNNPGNGSAA